MKSFFYVAQSFAKPFLALIFVTCSANLFAQQASLTVQGVLTKADGTAVEDDVYTLTFRLWNHPDATGSGNKKHEETINNVETVGGVYTVILGINGTPLSAGFDEVYYLGVSMNTSSVELLPRPRLTHAPYALGIKGQNNTFPSTGPVVGDAFRARGGAPIGGQGSNGNGFSFKPGGDESGGMFSREPNNIELWAGGQERMQLNTTQNEIYGQTVNFGSFISNTQTINGDQTTNGNSQVNGWQVVTGDERVEGNQLCNNKFLTKRASEGGGYTFDYDGGYDTGMFGIQDGEVEFRANGTSRLLIGSNGFNYQSSTVFSGGVAINDNGQPWNNSPLKVYGLKEGPSGGKNVQYDLGSGSIYWDNSSRKSKRDIQKFEEDFSKILLTEAKIYRRHGSPDSYWEIGYIAEEIDSLGLSHLATRGLDGQIDGLDYDRIGLYTVEMLKIQYAEIAAMKAEIAALKTGNEQLKASNVSLQSEKTQLQTTLGKQLEELARRLDMLENHQGEHNRK